MAQKDFDYFTYYDFLVITKLHITKYTPLFYVYELFTVLLYGSVKVKMISLIGNEILVLIVRRVTFRRASQRA